MDRDGRRVWICLLSRNRGSENDDDDSEMVYLMGSNCGNEIDRSNRMCNSGEIENENLCENESETV
jgi:hypothetical protein